MQGLRAWPSLTYSQVTVVLVECHKIHSHIGQIVPFGVPTRVLLPWLARCRQTSVCTLGRDRELAIATSRDLARR